MIAAGAMMPDFVYCTPFAQGLTLRETVARAKKTALIFLRYYGCTLCQYDIHEFAVHYAELTAGGGQLLVVLQSDPAKLAEQLTPNALPFDIVCDPNAELYERFSIEPAESMVKMADASTMVKIAKVTAAGYKHGDYEGNELQLPAVFVMDADCKLSYVHYGKTVSDLPSIEKLTELLK